MTVYVAAKFPRVPEYHIEEYSYLEQTPKGDKKIAECLSKQGWTHVMQGETATEMVDRLETGMKISYETRTRKKKVLSLCG